MKYFIALAIIFAAQLLFLTSAKAQMLSPAQVEIQRYYANTIVIPIQPGAVWQGGFAYGYNPLFIFPGTRVIWVNHDSVPHTATSNFGWWDTGVLYPGWGFQVIFGPFGDYPYHCRFHPGMWGRIVVR